MKKIFSLLFILTLTLLTSYSLNSSDRDHYLRETKKFLYLSRKYRNTDIQTARKYLKLSRENLDIANALKSNPNHAIINP